MNNSNMVSSFHLPFQKRRKEVNNSSLIPSPKLIPSSKKRKYGVKTVFCTSAALVILLLILFSIGILDYRNVKKEALIKGNAQYTAGDFEKALEFYAEGIQKEPEDFKLNFNSGQALYCLKEYEQAIAYYEKSSPDKIDKYLNLGNCSLRLGDAAADDNEKLLYYQQALESYKEGILKFPQEVSLKYNYEYVKEKIKQLQDNLNNRNENQQDIDNQQDNQQNEESKQNNEDQQGQDNENQQKNEEQQDNSQQTGENQQDNKDEQIGGNQENNENQQNSEQDSNDSRKNENNEDRQDNEESKEGNSQDNQKQSNSANTNDNLNNNLDENDSENNNENNTKEAGNWTNNQDNQYDEQSLQEIEQALRLLEKQEEESLKNNQGIRRSDRDDKYDW